MGINELPIGTGENICSLFFGLPQARRIISGKSHSSILVFKSKNKRLNNIDKLPFEDKNLSVEVLHILITLYYSEALPWKNAS